MGAHKVVALAELVKPGLAMSQIQPRESLVKQFNFEGAVEAFLFTLGLRMERPAMEDIDSQAQQPDSQLSIARRALDASPRAAVIAENATGQAVTSKDALQASLDRRSALIGASF